MRTNIIIIIVYIIGFILFLFSAPYVHDMMGCDDEVDVICAAADFSYDFPFLITFIVGFLLILVISGFTIIRIAQKPKTHSQKE